MSVQIHALRLHPGQDLRRALGTYAQEEALEAAVIVSAIGSLETAALRFAGQSEAQVLQGPFELLSLAGTLSTHGLHLHGAIANGAGSVCGGHIAAGCVIYTTAEVAIAALPGYSFRREIDPQTGYRELCINPARQESQ
ncbi:Bifunctional protein GlmU [Halomicronema hongdechloris C2206]|uniref:Bifunctional protein GlmU n=1 Tax=Halomicronema hongdechloris C2206 TaxID=1641165 RepID=A0A1Z3HHI1_9CYAN|nr:PPC domain-containing DNA-binding protein [Halomicronema hongdechloris]ASC69723.1 Bifunctional protein GlmU [Halomicronema hongdechloris C2206]